MTTHSDLPNPKTMLKIVGLAATLALFTQPWFLFPWMFLGFASFAVASLIAGHLLDLFIWFGGYFLLTMIAGITGLLHLAQRIRIYRR